MYHMHVCVCMCFYDCNYDILRIRDKSIGGKKKIKINNSHWDEKRDLKYNIYLYSFSYK